jgi:hypothetical protein
VLQIEAQYYKLRLRQSFVSKCYNVRPSIIAGAENYKTRYCFDPK